MKGVALTLIVVLMVPLAELKLTPVKDITGLVEAVLSPANSTIKLKVLWEEIHPVTAWFQTITFDWDCLWIKYRPAENEPKKKSERPLAK